MCGLVGAAGDLDLNSEKAVKMLLVLDVFRGEDSTGIASVGKFQGAEVRIAKALGNPFNLFESKRFDKVMSQSHRALIGHNRFATSGGISTATAHPFEFDGLVGVHNGTLTNKHELLDHNDFKVDSENLYHHINEKGVDDAIKNTSGAWALVWWDKVAGSLRMLRNKERPLWVCNSEDDKQIYWASERWMLYAALGRTGIKFKDAVEIKEDYLYSYRIDNGGKMDNPLVRELKGKETKHSFTGRGAATGTNKPADTQKGKVLALPKKKDVHKGAEALLMPSTKYMGREGVLLQKVGDYVDGYGAPYVDCFDVDEPNFQIRLYVHAQHGMETKPKGTTFRSNISGFTSHEGGYYKASPWYVSDVETPATQEHRNHKGAMIPAAEWEALYGECAFCNDAVSAEDSAYVILTTSGQCLCRGCSTDTEITNLVSSANVMH